MALSDAVVVVTGASAGVGRASAVAFARRGAHVGLIARGHEGLKGTQADVEELGRRALSVETDVADAGAVEAAADQIERGLGPIDVWVNNAMVSALLPFVRMDPADFRRITEVTYLGYVYGTMAALRRMVPRDRGTVVQVGSALAYRSIPLQSAYCGAKRAIAGFTESVRTELLHDRSNVRLTVVDLPALNTPQFHWVKTDLPGHPQPVPPIFQPEVAARAIVWAAERAPRRVPVGAPTALATLAQKFIPGLLDHYLARTGFDSQQASFPTEPGRPDNLWRPVPGDHGSHGAFDDRSKDRSLHWELRSRPRLVAATAAAAAVWLLQRRNRAAAPRRTHS
jgi:NAD(P)-dependent dehydrogenase (short-subunit alcohol dehydrogenase family)